MGGTDAKGSVLSVPFGGESRVKGVKGVCRPFMPFYALGDRSVARCNLSAWKF